MYKVVIFLLASLLHTGLLAQVYYPDRIDYGNPADQGLSYKNVFFQSSDGTTLHGWLIKGKESKGTIIHFHGNAQNISSHFRGISWLANEGFFLLTGPQIRLSHTSTVRLYLIRLTNQNFS